MSEIIKNNNNEMTSLENDLAVESKDEKSKTCRSSNCILTIPVVRGVTGVVKWFSAYKGYGFITRDDDESDTFIHISAIVRGDRYYNAPTEGDKVEFDVIQGFKGPEAWSVTGLDGKPIQGVRLLTNYNRSFNNARNGSKTFRPSNGRRRRNTNVPRDDVLESDHNGDAETKNLKIETEIEVNAKGDSSNEKPKYRKNSSNKSAKRSGKSKTVVSSISEPVLVCSK